MLDRQSLSAAEGHRLGLATGWLNDEIINYWVELWQNPDDSHDRTWTSLNSFFFKIAAEAKAEKGAAQTKAVAHLAKWLKVRQISLVKTCLTIRSEA